jgi:hypothetical protein
MIFRITGKIIYNFLPTRYRALEHQGLCLQGNREWLQF